MKSHRSAVLTERRPALKLSHRYPFLVLCSVLALSALLSTAHDSAAQKKKAPPPPAGSPNLAMPQPMGMQRGTALELVLTGANLTDPINLWSTIPGLKASIPTDNDNGTDPAKLRVVLEAPKEAPLGFHALRLGTKHGVSNLRLFCIDDLPQVVKDGKNKAKDAAQAVPIPSVVCGRIDAETADYYKITVAAGQRLSFNVLGRRLGSPFDPQIAVIDPRNQREVAFSNDAPGLQTDSCVTHIFKDAGDYLIEVRDVMHRGGPDYVYRLRIGDFPCATTPIPMAAKRGSKIPVKFAGTFVDGVAPVEVTVPTDPTVNTVWVAPKGPSGLHGWPVALAISDIDEVVEQEPNNEPAKANRVPVPGAVTGRFEQKGDQDYYVFNLKKGKYAIEAQTLELYSPTEVYMVLKDAKGADVAKTNPQAAPRIDFTAPADADYTLMVEHLHYWGGPAESYRISITPAETTFEVAVGDRFDLPQGNAGMLPIQAVTSPVYKGPIELTIVGHPGITGSKVIDSQAKAPQPNQPVAQILVTAKDDVLMGGHPVRIQAKAKIDGKDVVTYATVRPAVSQALAALPFPPRDMLNQVVVGVTEKPPFTLALKLEQPDVIRGGAVPLTITATRAEGFDSDIALTPFGLPPQITTALKAIPKGANEAKGELKIDAKAPLGDHPISFTGKAKKDNKEFTVTAIPVALPVVQPFTLKVEPAPFKIDTGAKVKLKVIAERKGGYKGPIGLEIRGLPTNVTAPKVAIEQDKNDVEIEIAAADNAVVGDKADVNVLGTATAAGNQQNATANFTVTVNKK
jgi:hypothetical protein